MVKQRKLAKRGQAAQTFGKTSRLTRADVKEPQDTEECFSDLEQRARETKDAIPTGIRKLPRDQIFVAEKAFQWRTPRQNISERTRHVLDLAKVLVDGGGPLDAILVYPIGARYYVVDGHHRLAAYDTAKWTQDIPATVFNGTLAEARLEGLKLNSKNKLALTDQDKQEAAWELVKQKAGSKRKISEWTGVSTSNIANMRRVLERLKKDPIHAEEVAGATWAYARRLDLGLQKKAPDDDWLEKEADKLAAQLLKVNLGQGLMKNPDVTALALEKLNPKIPRALIEQWIFDPQYDDLIEGLLEERDQGPGKL